MSVTKTQFGVLSVLSLVIAAGAFAAVPSSVNCRTQTLYREKKTPEAPSTMRYQGQSIEATLSGCLNYAASIEDWLVNRYDSSATKWEYFPSNRYAYGKILALGKPKTRTMRPTLCLITEYSSKDRKQASKVVFYSKTFESKDQCMVRVESRVARLQGRNLIRFEISDSRYVLDGTASN